MAGSSFLRAAVLRALQCENGAARGEKVGHLLWDMKKFYDSVRLPDLARELWKRKYPQHLLILGFMTHAGRRVLKVGKSLGPTITDCSNSMVAGCQQAVSWARGILRELVEKLSLVDPEFPVHVHVDDLSHVLVAETNNELERKLLEAGRIVGREVKSLSLALADKSRLILETPTTI